MYEIRKGNNTSLGETKLNRVTLLTEQETAKLLNVSIKWLQSKRYSGGGIRITKMGRSVRYSVENILEYIEKNTVENSIQGKGLNNA